MRHGTTKILTLLLALIMLLSMVPLSAYAFGAEGKELVTARGEAEKISAHGTRGVFKASGEKKAGSLLIGLARDGSSAYTVTFTMNNRAASSMYSGVDAALPASLDVDLSGLANAESFGAYEIRAAIDAQSTKEKKDLPGVGNIPLDSPRILRIDVDSTAASTFRFNGQQLQYLSSDTWVDVTADQTITLRYIPWLKYVKFDPGTADQAVDTGGIFRGAYTNARGETKEGDQYLLCYSASTSTPGINDEYYGYKMLDAQDWPGTPHLIGSPNLGGFLYWRQRPSEDTGAFWPTTYRVTSADSVIRVYRSGNNKPLVVAIYRFTDKGNSTNVDPLYSDDTSIPSQGDDSPEPGTVRASKGAVWADRTAGIGKITLTVGGVPYHTGSDVVFIMDYSCSMGPRYDGYDDLYLQQREAPLKVSVWNAINTLLGNASLNNRVALVAFSGSIPQASYPAVSVYLKTTNEIDLLQKLMYNFETYGHLTYYNQGLVPAINILNNRGASADRPAHVIFLTDGLSMDEFRANANTLKNIPNTDVYAIGIQTNAMSSLRIIASNNSMAYEIDTPEQLEPLIASIVGAIASAGTDAVFTDTISEYYDAFTAEELAAYNSEHGTSYAHSAGVTVDADHKTVTVDVGDITGTLDNPQTFDIYIKIEPDHVGDVNLQDQKTNDDIVLNYKDRDGGDKSIPKALIGDPELGRFKNAVQIIYTLVDENGNYIDESGNPVTTPVQIGATLNRTGLDLIDQATRSYTVYSDVNPDDPSVTIDQSTVLGKLWGAMPSGYLLYGESSQTATITTDNTVVPVVEFKLYIPVVSVSVTKVWDDEDDQDGIRPESVTIKLLANNTPVTGKSVTLPIAGSTNPWSYTWEDLPKYPAGTTTNPIAYTVAEDPVPRDYTAAVTGDMEAGFTVTNKHTPAMIDIKVTKVWKDNNNSGRPTSVTIKLLADGEETGKSLVLTKENGWTGSFTDLPKYANKKLIQYTVSEEQVSGYQEPVITGSAANGFVVTNSKRTPGRSPFTGDTRAWLPWVGLLVLSGGLLGVDAIVRKRKRKE